MKLENLTLKNSFGILAITLVALTGCDLDITNPNAASEDEVLTTRDGIVSLATGIQQYHATAFLEAVIVDPGMTTKELATTTTLANYLELEQGGTDLPTGNFNILRNWSRPMRLINMADQLIENTDNVELEAGTRSGILALAHFHRAAALGALAQNFENAPVDLDVDETAEFADRMDVFAAAIASLDAAIELLENDPSSVEFETRVLGDAFDLSNSLHAYRARYLLFSGQHQQAYDAAAEVDETAASWFTLDSDNHNPIFNIHSDDGLGYVAPRHGFGSPLTEEGDERIEFYMNEVPDSSVNNHPVGELRGFFESETSDIPVYLTGEMTLIQAEAAAHMDGPAAAVPYIDEVRTKTAGEDPYGLGANLPAYDGPTDMDSILEEIYRQRISELFLTGLRLEDSRRLGRPDPLEDDTERTRNFYPYPDQERLNNPNTPGNPAI